jgi:glutathionylspermidine synthase
VNRVDSFSLGWCPVQEWEEDRPDPILGQCRFENFSKKIFDASEGSNISIAMRNHERHETHEKFGISQQIKQSNQELMPEE